MSVQRQVHFSATAVAAARSLKEEFAYGLLPARLLHPDNFSLPAEAIESKRAVLLGLAPMLDDAEKQRKIDVAVCQAHTRCRIDSKRTRASWYQYSDVDAQLAIDPSEYEDR
jgi:hypothetical protein